MCETSDVPRQEAAAKKTSGSRHCETCGSELGREHKRYCSHVCHSLGARTKPLKLIGYDLTDELHSAKLACDLHLADLANAYECPEPVVSTERPVNYHPLRECGFGNSVAFSCVEFAD